MCAEWINPGARQKWQDRDGHLTHVLPERNPLTRRSGHFDGHGIQMTHWRPTPASGVRLAPMILQQMSSSRPRLAPRWLEAAEARPPLHAAVDSHNQSADNSRHAVSSVPARKPRGR